jgi:hypothetical protein
MKHLWLVLLLIASGAQANIGKITELQGTAVEIKRGSKSIKASKDSVIESNDTVSVGSNTKLTITFSDNSTAKITENSKLIIDDFVYDPKGGASKSSMKVALGTVRMASGAIAKNSAQNVNIKTPTAAIAVRGTDFAMTVDELGRSTVVLLPSCKDDRDAQRVELPGNCVCGAIDVTTTAGKVSMDSPFLATYAVSHQESPLPPVQVDPSVMNAYGEGSLKKPEQVVKAVAERDQKKEERKDRSRANDDERKAARDNNDEVARKDREGNSDRNIQRALSGEIGTTKVGSTEQTAGNPCWPFTSCGNEKGYNWYEHVDPLRGNVIHIRSLETTDTTTYNISVNNVDISQRQVGSGANGNVVTVRQWNR